MSGLLRMVPDRSNKGEYSLEELPADDPIYKFMKDYDKRVEQNA